VEFSIRYPARHFDALGADRRELEVKVCGGADVLPTPDTRDRCRTVGAQNRRAAMEVPTDERSTALATDLGGQRGRVVFFNTGTGEVLVRRWA
jgi:chemotaxis protein CheD